MNDPIKTLESELARVTEDLEALRRERDEWKARFEGEAEVCSLYRDELATYKSSKPEWDRILNQTVHERDAERERSDALAAHVERWKEFGESLKDRYPLSPWITDEAGTLVHEAPQSSLARLKAQWQAEALRSLLDNEATRDWEGNACVWQEDVEEHLEEYRRQAEGGEL